MITRSDMPTVSNRGSTAQDMSWQRATDCRLPLLSLKRLDCCAHESERSLMSWYTMLVCESVKHCGELLPETTQHLMPMRQRYAASLCASGWPSR